MADFTQQIQEIEKEIRETPYHKGTEHHIGKLRARLARIKDKIQEGQTRSSGGGGGGYALKKHGDATVVLIGPPSVGKSTLINKLTNVESKVAAYPFTTVSVIPGMLKYNDAYIQIFDLPGIIEGAKEGKGKGKEVLAVTRNSDLILIMCDVDTYKQFNQIIVELEGAGIRINKIRPDVIIDKQTKGGLIVHSNIRQSLEEGTIKEIASEMGLKNADISLKQKVSIDDLIDAFSSSRVYIPALFVINKIDTVVKKPVFDENVIQISAEKEISLNTLKEEIWKKLDLVRIYLVHPDEEPSLNNPIIMKKGDTLSGITKKLGTSFVEEKTLAKIWGPGARFPGQEVSLSFPVQEGIQVRFL